MVSGLTLATRRSPKDTSIPLFFPTANSKTSASELIVNFDQTYQGLAQSVLIDNQSATDSCTVRINGQVNTITIPASSFRAWNDIWIEQVNITGSSTNVQVSAQVVPRTLIPL